MVEEEKTMVAPAERIGEERMKGKGKWRKKKTVTRW